MCELIVSTWHCVRILGLKTGSQNCLWLQDNWELNRSLKCWPLTGRVGWVDIWKTLAVLLLRWKAQSWGFVCKIANFLCPGRIVICCRTWCGFLGHLQRPAESSSIFVPPSSLFTGDEDLMCPPPDSADLESQLRSLTRGSTRRACWQTYWRLRNSLKKGLPQTRPSPMTFHLDRVSERSTPGTADIERVKMKRESSLTSN